MSQAIVIRGKKDGNEIPVLVDEDGKIETTATLVGDVTLADVEITNFPATQVVSGEVTVHEIQNKVPVGTVDKVTAVDTITNKVNVDTIDKVTAIDGTVDVQLIDEYGWESELTPQGEVRTVAPFRLVGAQFTGNTVDSNFWTASAGTGGTVSQANQLLTLATGVTDDNDVSVTSVRKARYIGGSSNRFRGNFAFGDTGVAGNVRRFGAYDANDGFFIELNGTNIRFGIRKAAADTIIAQASWNVNTTFTIDTNIHTYEIYWTNKSVWFNIDDSLKHKASATTAPLVGNLVLPIKMENNNGAGLASNKNLYVANAVIHRLGLEHTLPMAKYVSGATSAVLKYGGGKVQRIIFTPGANNNTLILYDNTSGTTELLKVTGQTGVTYAFEANAPFYTGLFYSMTGANSSATIIYE